MAVDDTTRATFETLTREALTLRFSVPTPHSVAAPAEVAEAMSSTRAALDRVEQLLVAAIRARAKALDTAAVATAALDDGWDTAIHRLRGEPVTTGGEYATARERHAAANLATLDLRHAVRTADELVRLCTTTVEVIRLAHRGLDGARHDLRERVRAVAFESHLDR